MTTESTLLAEDVDVMVDDIQFRERVRAFLDAHAPRRDDETAAEPPSLEGAVGHDAVAHARAYQTALYDAGLAGLTWPRRYGGQGLSPSYQTAFHEISTDYSTPDGLFIVGFGMCIPTILTHGTEAMKHRYVKPAARGEEIWCQLFSEPSAGSDVAGLRSRAVVDGDEWILDGQKVWTSGAQFSQFGIVLARTDPNQPKHRGLSMFVLDMRAEGVTVRPLRQMNGGSGFNEVFFDNVRIPADQIIGAPGEGWRVALTTLMNERVAIGAGRSGEKSSPLAPISLHLDLSAARGLRGDPRVRQALIDFYIRHRVLDFVGLRIRAAIAQGREPGPEGSIAKLYGSLLSRRSADVAAGLAGPGATAWSSHDDGHSSSQMVLTAPSAAIAGGTSEVMRNILGERVLGLPKEPSVDRDVPFRDLLQAGPTQER